MATGPATFRPAYMGERSEREAERQKLQAQWRGSASSRGYGARWQRTRAGWLAKRPLCVCCEANGRVTPAVVLDHIKDAVRWPELFWVPSNWQGLCDACNLTIKAPIEHRHRAGLADDAELSLARPMPEHFVQANL